MIETLLKCFVKDYKNTTDQAVRERYGVFSGITGIILNIFISAFKFFAGIISNSMAISADAVNNLSDAASSVVTLVGAKLANKPADREHPFGHGRMEYISALLVSFAILFVGIELLKSSITKIFNPEPVIFGYVSLIILIVSILVKLWMAYFNNDLNKRIDSPPLRAVVTDSLSDCIATSSTIIVLIVGKIWNISIDGYIGVIVAAIIIKSGAGIVKDIVSRIVGQPPSPELIKKIEDKVTSYDGILGTHDLIVHDYGPSRMIASIHAEVSEKADIVKIHDVIDNIEQDFADEMGIFLVVHMDPIVTDNEHVNKMKETVSEILKEVNPELTLHDFKMVEGPTHTNIIFDMVVPYSEKRKSYELKEEVAKRVRKLSDKYYLVIQTEHSYTGSC